jgi:hypothetical protein
VDAVTRLVRLSRKELTAMSDRDQRMAPNPAHLASALLTLLAAGERVLGEDVE